MIFARALGRVRGADHGNFAENQSREQPHLNSSGSVIVSNGLPSKAEIVRLGRSWQVLSGAIGSLTVVPTTLGVTTLYNGDRNSWLAIDSVSVARVIVHVTTNDLTTVWAQIVRPPITPFPAESGLSISSLSGKYSYDGQVKTNLSFSTIAGRWEAIGTVPNDSAAIAGSAWGCVDIDLLGRFLIPPGAAFTTNVSEVTAEASSYRLCYRWHEVTAPLVS